MIPGQNILNMALTLIARQTIVYYKFIERTLNEIGQDITVYADPLLIVGSFQPVAREVYDVYGLDLQKSYFVLFTSNDVLDINRDVSGDQIAFNNQRFQVESSTNWYNLDGWKELLCVRIEPDFSSDTIFGYDSVPEINNNQNFSNGVFFPPKGSS